MAPADAAAESAARKNRDILVYQALESRYIFVQLAFEQRGEKFIAEVGLRLIESGDDPRIGLFLAQRLRRNGSVMGTFASGSVRVGLFDENGSTKPY